MGMPSGVRTSSCAVAHPPARRPANVRRAANPDPSNFRIVRVAAHGSWLVAEVKYPDCVNFEGRKILVFEKLSVRQLHRLTTLDPHFCNDGHVSPFARFVPSEAGWAAAIAFVTAAS